MIDTRSRSFALGFSAGLLLFALLNLLAAHVRSDCGILAVLRMANCADDIIRIGFPWVVFEEGGFAYRNLFSALALTADVVVALAVSLALGFVSQRYWGQARAKKPTA